MSKCTKCGRCDGGYYGSAQETSWVECKGPPKRKSRQDNSQIALAKEVASQQRNCRCATCLLLRALTEAEA